MQCSEAPPVEFVGPPGRGSLDGLSCVVLDLAGEEGLADAVRSLLVQDPAEVVVVSSGGGDPAGRLRAAGIDVPVVTHPQRLFAGGVRNAGIAHTRGRWVAFMAADCIAQPGYVAARLHAHRDGAAVVAGALANAHPESRSAGASHLLLHHRRMADTPAALAIVNPSSFDRAVFEAVGTFRDDLRTGEDTELLARLPASLAPRWVPEVGVAHRYPTTPLALVREQFGRGRRRVEAERDLGRSGGRLALALGSVRNVRAALAQIRRTHDPVERRRLTRAVPLLPLGALGYAAGVLLAPPAHATGGDPLTRRTRGPAEAPRA
jgi:glycosyltransferase involved in cell wall biosynthesis